MIDLHMGHTNLMTAGFLKQQKLLSQVEDKLDGCLTGKVIFTLTLTKIRPRPHGKLPISLNMLDLILHLLVADLPSSSATAIDNCLCLRGSPDLAALTPALDS